jgi:hypothetical protein
MAMPKAAWPAHFSRKSRRDQDEWVGPTYSPLRRRPRRPLRALVCAPRDSRT